MVIKRGKIDLTLEEVIATLKNTNLPTVVLEGEDDIMVLRRLEDIYAERFLSVFSVGGRDKVLQAYERRNELPPETKFIFVADLDLWVFGNKPPRYEDQSLIFSDGYSIENDAIRDGIFRSLMTASEAGRFELELDDICAWFAHVADANLKGGAERLKCHPQEILSNPEMIAACKDRIANDNDLASFFDGIRGDPDKLLRGKTLIHLMMRQLSYTGRAANHQHAALLDSVGANPGPIIRRMFERIGFIIDN